MEKNSFQIYNVDYKISKIQWLYLFFYSTIMATVTSVNPYTQQVNATFETLSDNEVNMIIDRAHQAYLSRKNLSFTDRAQYCFQLADLLDKHNDELAKLETMEMGRLLSVAKKWLTSTADLIRWYAHNAESYLAPKQFNEYWIQWITQYDPLWVIFWVAPWNFPFNQLLRAAVANIMAWNTVVYKHASNVPLCAQAIHDLFEKAWFPEWVYTNLFVHSSQSEFIIAHKYIAWVNLTWSEGAWSAIWSLAWKYLKPSVLELWWNDAFVLLDHNDTEAMANVAMQCRISNWWQRCNASKRFIVLEKHYDQFVDALVSYMEWLVLGDPMHTDTTLPPLAKKQLVEEVHQQVTDTIAQWAICKTWWSALMWNFYAPTVLAHVKPGMVSFEQEIFGPVASVILSWSIEESIALANQSEFWLSAVVYWDNSKQCQSVAHRLQWWMIFINMPAWSQASLPFGGIKKSWYGKENGPDWLRAFTNKKVIILKKE